MTERTDELANEVAAKVVADELKQAVEEEAEVAAAPSFEVILASNSPRRRELLNAAGVKFTVRTPVTPVDESLEPDLAADPEEAAKKLAERKAGAVIQEVLAENYTGMLIVIGADTMVVLDGKIFGKPRSASDGKHMLRQLSGRTHEVITAVSVWMVAAPNAEDVSLGFRTFADISHVTFRDLTDEEITDYLRKGESDVDFCLEMAEKVGVACVPGTSFFNENVNNIVRVHFAKKDETLYEALDRLSHLKEKMR